MPRTLLLLLTILALVVPMRAQVPGTLSYQGYLEQNGAPVSGTRALTFRLYAAPTGGAALWDEAHAAVAVAEGVFAVALGAAAPLNALAFDRPYWLGVQVGAGAELAPRSALLSAPYALRAAAAEGVSLPFDGSTNGGTTALAATHTGTNGITVGVAGTTQAPSGYGVFGHGVATVGENYGVVGRSDSPDGAGLYGVNVTGRGPAYGGLFLSASTQGRGVFGWATAASGVTYGVLGWADSPNGYGVYGRAPVTVVAYAGYFDGNVRVTGTLSKLGGGFQIDHPLDPENKYLAHSFVESPDMMNMYNGTVTTDARGYATVELPAWFETLNRDFRYQLTTIGSFSRVMIAERISGNRFVIQTEEPNVEVSWQVTGIRHDVWADQHRIPVEAWKQPEERGRYLSPEAYGLPRERGVAYLPDEKRRVEAGTLPRHER